MINNFKAGPNRPVFSADKCGTAAEEGQGEHDVDRRAQPWMEFSEPCKQKQAGSFKTRLTQRSVRLSPITFSHQITNPVQTGFYLAEAPRSTHLLHF